MKTDIEIAQSVKMQHITKIADAAGIDPGDIELYGNYNAKVDLSVLKKKERKGSFFINCFFNKINSSRNQEKQFENKENKK